MVDSKIYGQMNVRGWKGVDVIGKPFFVSNPNWNLLKSMFNIWRFLSMLFILLQELKICSFQGTCLCIWTLKKEVLMATWCLGWSLPCLKPKSTSKMEELWQEETNQSREGTAQVKESVNPILRNICSFHWTTGN